MFGVKSDWARDMLYAAHKGSFDLATTEDREVPVVITDFATAELVKVAANAFLATKISFINAMAEVCDAAGADVTQLARAIGYDARIGKKFLRAGVGFGGGCLPKDIRAFQARAQELGVGEALRFLHEVDLINQRRRHKVVELAAELLDRPAGPAGPDLSGLRIAVLGATFKPNSDDVRDSPALSVVRRLARTGAEVAVYDPAGMANAERELPDVDLREDARRRGHRRRPASACSPSGKSSATPTRSRSPSWSPAPASSTAGTASIRWRGRRPVGFIAAWDARDQQRRKRSEVPTSAQGRTVGILRVEQTRRGQALGSYPCSNCGATADTSSGCPSCGRSLEAEIGGMDQHDPVDAAPQRSRWRRIARR